MADQLIVSDRRRLHAQNGAKTMFDAQKVFRTQPMHIEIMSTLLLQRVEYLDGKLELQGSDVVTSWDPEPLARVMTGHGIAALRFSTEMCVMVDLGNEAVSHRVTLARSGTYFINGRVRTLDEMRRLHVEDAMYMQQQGWRHAVLFAHGGCTGYDYDTDHIVTL